MKWIWNSPARRLTLLAVIVLILSCSSENKNSDKQVFRYNDATGIYSLDPAFAKDQSHIWVCQQLYDGLVELDSMLIIRPSIASAWKLLKDENTYEFTLRNDVYFIDNESYKIEYASDLSRTRLSRKVTAWDVVYSLNRLTDPEVASPGAWVMNMVEKDPSGRLTGIYALNDSTLRIRLTAPFPPFLSLLAMPYCSVVQKEVVEMYGKDFRAHPAGTGPFLLAYWKEGVKLVLHRNPHYFQTTVQGDHLPYLDAVEIGFINDKQSAFLEFLKGNLDLISGIDASYKDELLTPAGDLQPRHRGHFQLETMPYLNTEYLGILVDSTLPAMHQSPLNDLRIRKALNLSFDRVAMIRYLRNNRATPGIYGFVPPGIPSFMADSTIGYSYDPEAARRLLREAGHPDGKGLDEIVLSTTATYMDLCEFIKSQWEEIGLRVRIDVNQAAVHRKMVAEQKLTFFRGSWIADYPDAENYLSLFLSVNSAPAGPNYTHFSNPEFDALYEAAAIADDAARNIIYRKMDRLVMEQAPVIVLYYDQVVRLTSKDVHGLPANAMNLLQLKYAKKTR
ncbi:MAG: hypothetical protein RL021_2241 [Bacteroidota bacterium]|jgi:peptide/nickel transport system substrate-binding protein